MTEEYVFRIYRKPDSRSPSPEKRLLAFGQLLLALLPACGGTAQHAAEFSGTAGLVRVSPEDVQDWLILPQGYEVVGEVSVVCFSHERTDALFFLNTRGSCHVLSLVQGLAEEVSRVGGEAMVGRRCDSDSDEYEGFDDKPARSEMIRCRAAVVRRSVPKMEGGAVSASLTIPSQPMVRSASP